MLGYPKLRCLLCKLKHKLPIEIEISLCEPDFRCVTYNRIYDCFSTTMMVEDFVSATETNK